MSIKRVFKKIVSLTPKWLFNFFISFTTNKKMECDEVSLESFNPDNGHSSLEVVRTIGIWKLLLWTMDLQTIL